MCHEHSTCVPEALYGGAKSKINKRCVEFEMFGDGNHYFQNNRSITYKSVCKGMFSGKTRLLKNNHQSGVLKNNRTNWGLTNWAFNNVRILFLLKRKGNVTDAKC